MNPLRLGVARVRHGRRAERVYAAGFDAAPDPIAVLDPGGAILAVNPAWERLAADDGGDLGRLPPGTHFVRERAAGAPGRWIEIEDRVRPDGMIVRLARDLTERKRTQLDVRAAEVRRRLQAEVNAALAAAQSFADASEKILPALARAAGWDVAIYWKVDGADEALRCESIWTAPDLTAPTFLAATRRFPVKHGQGLPGRVWALGEAARLDDVSVEDDPMRGMKAEQEGLTSAFAFPLLAGGATFAVLELWSRGPTERNDDLEAALLDSGRQIGAQLGHLREKETDEERLRNSEERYRTITEMAQDAIISIDEDGIIVSVNRAAEKLFLFERGEMVGRPLTILMPNDSRQAHTEGLQRYRTSRQRRISWDRVEVQGRRKDGTIVLLEMSLAEFPLDGRRVFTGYMRDITAQREEETALRYQVLHDPLTNLPNRMLLKERLDRGILVGRRHDTSLSLIFMDLDQFKEVNDTFGHHFGDLLLQQVANRIGRAVRESDTVARLGGDEFALLLPMTDEEAAKQAAQRITALMAEPFTIEGRRLDIGASLGIAVFPSHAGDASALMRHADLAMYAAKRAGTPHSVYSEERDGINGVRLVIAADLREAIGGNQLYLHYQPKIGLRLGGADSVEALVRWQHPTRGFMPPDTFITIAEESGLIAPLTDWVLDEALRQHLAWRERGLDIRVSVNFSARTLRERELVDSVLRRLQQHGVETNRLQVEITESALMLDPERALDTLMGLHSAGVRTSIDDFGTGYSSLGYLKTLPVDELKIDRSFVMDMANSRDDETIVSTVVTLGHNLGLEVVAEGVENQRTLDELAAMGCDFAQGYFVSRPLPADELTTWLLSHDANLRDVARAS